VNFLAWATQRRHIAVSVFKTGHSQYVAGTDRVSNHWYGRAADIYAVDGEDFSPSCRPCRGFVEEILSLGEGRPHELGQPWSDVAAGAGWNVFADDAHANHAHVGWGPA
jgi:hypothetical protein